MKVGLSGQSDDSAARSIDARRNHTNNLPWSLDAPRGRAKPDRGVDATPVVERVLAFQLEESMRKARLTKSEMARRMRTTRAQLDRLLDPDNPSTTLQTLVKAAGALGKRLNISLVKG